MENGCYQYTPLPSHEAIRLLEIHQNEDPVISASLIVVFFVDAPPFDCLSYTWGSSFCELLDDDITKIETAKAHQKFPLLCDGQVLHIGKNLQDALYKLRRLSLQDFGRTKSRYVWIDAVCINQNDIPERETQVAIMHSLYARAETVIAWLGPADRTTPDAMTVMRRMNSSTLIRQHRHCKLMDPGMMKAYSNIGRDAVFSEDIYRTVLKIKPLTERQWLAWVAFVSRPYWSRAWIAQEIVAAKSIIALCGEDMFEWEDFASVTAFTTLTGWIQSLHPMQLKHKFLKGPVSNEYLRLVDCKSFLGGSALALVQSQKFHLEGLPFTLRWLLTQHRGFQASDPRDLIFALVNIARKDRAPFVDHAHVLRPSYNISVETLFTRTTRAIMEGSGTLDFLDAREPRNVDIEQSLPSWVANFTQALLPNP